MYLISKLNRSVQKIRSYAKPCQDKVFMNTGSRKNLFLHHLMRHRKKIMLLAVISLLTSGFLPYSFRNSEKPKKNNQTSHTKLCCCRNLMNTCVDCSGGCCSEDSDASSDYSETDKFQGSDYASKQDSLFISCHCNPDDNFFSPELHYYLVSSFPIIHYSPFITSSETNTLIIKDSLLAPPYKPPKSLFFSL